MARKKTTVFHLFTEITKPDSKCVKKIKCKFCSTDVAKNGTRMESHIRMCLKVTDDIKFRYLPNPIASKVGLKSHKKPQLQPLETVDSDSDMEVNPAVPATSQALPAAAVEASGPSDPTHAQSGTSELHDQDEAVDRSTTRSTPNTPRPKHLARIFTSPQSASPIVSTPKKVLKTPTHSRELSFTSPLAFADKMSSQNERITEHLARAIYATGAPLSLVDNKYWRKCFSTLRPAYQPPSRYQITNNLLTNEFERIQMECQLLLSTTTSVAILCDGWTNIRNEAIVNFVLTTPSPIFWSSISTGSDSHTADYMAQEITKVIEDVGPPKVLAICTDNAANMKKAWEIINKDFQHINCYGCLAHGLNLIFADALKLKTLSKLITQCCTVIKTIKYSHVLLAVFKEKQAANKMLRMLQLPVKTRWGSTVHCLTSILVNKQALRSLAIDERDSVQKALNKDVQKSILDDVLWDRVVGFNNLLKPIATAITKMEGDVPMISDVMKVFAELNTSIEHHSLTSPLLKNEEKEMKDIIKKRKNFCVKPIHFAANLLDPRYRGEHLTEDENVDACELVFTVAKSMSDVNDDTIMEDLANYNSKQGLFSKPFLWSGMGPNTSPSAWWLGLCRTKELSKVAARILSLPSSSAAVERSFSTYSHIHTKKRNKLTNEHASKIVYIAHNLKLLHKDDNMEEQEDEDPDSRGNRPRTALLPSSSSCSAVPTTSTQFTFDSFEIETSDVEEEEEDAEEQEDVEPEVLEEDEDEDEEEEE